MSKKASKSIYINKSLKDSIEKNIKEIVEYDGITKFSAFTGTESQFYEYLLTLGLASYAKEKQREDDET